MNTPSLDRFSYDDDITRKFLLATVFWGTIGMLVGLLIALQLANPMFNLGLEWTRFGRLRPLHTNAVIFAFAGNAIFMGVYYSLQRLLKARMFSDLLGRIHFWGWQAIIVADAITLPLGITQSREYAELEWPIEIAVSIGLNTLFATLAISGLIEPTLAAILMPISSARVVMSSLRRMRGEHVGRPSPRAARDAQPPGARPVLARNERRRVSIGGCSTSDAFGGVGITPSNRSSVVSYSS